MQTALFIILPASGHLNPSFRVAETLRKYSIRCVFVSAPDCREKILLAGFEYVAMASLPFGTGVEDGLDWKKKAPYIESLLDRAKDISYNLRKADYARLMKQFKPDYLFIDVFYSTDFILAHQYLEQTKVFFIQTMLSTYNDGTTPPINSDVMPNQAKNAWIKTKIKQKYILFSNTIKYFGFHNLSIIKRKFKENQVPEQYDLDLDKVFHVGFKNIPELVLAPLAFEFSEKRIKENQYYLGSMIQPYPETIIERKFEKLFEKIKLAKAQGKKIIYCSLGTIHLIHTKGKSEKFFNKVIESFSQSSDYEVIISVGVESKDKIKSPVSHIHVFESVPQRALLQEVDLFITHGGLNSVQESILAQVPMIVYPLNDKWDQNGNAARVVYHGLGLQGKLKAETAKDVLRKVETVLNSHENKLNIAKMSKKLSESYNDDWVEQLSIHTTLHII